ncbi:hypothetical protein GCM10009764_48430 [Nocardia ninae]|uniref:Uncharacterized protein n=1 Tax=Nocardia ninae NBRC 108245 TaxID=1210091 RepID=A0A511ME15_9NOCA|nr:hypothetical protein NN4_29060 [Nocardia ninae NBRC 108245]
MRFLAIELVESRPKLTERCWPRWVYGPIGKIRVGYPLAISERWLRPTKAQADTRPAREIQ